MLEERTDWVRPTLRPYQHRALEGWHAVHRRGIVCGPNAGRLGIALLASLRTSALVLCADRPRVVEWTRTLPRWCSGAVGLVVDDVASIESVTLMTFDDARRRLPEIGARFDLLIVDGVDRLSAEIATDIASAALPEARLGLATRTLGETLGAERAMALLGRVICEASTPPSSSRETVRLWVELDVDERAKYAELRRRGGLEGNRDAARLAAFPRSKRALVSSLLRDHRIDRTYVFAGFADAARAIADDVGIPAVDSDLSREKREAIVAAFREGAFRAVVCAHGLMGIDDPPPVNVVISVPGALGEGTHRLSLSGVLRPRPGRLTVAYELVTSNTIDDRPTSFSP